MQKMEAAMQNTHQYANIELDDDIIKIALEAANDGITITDMRDPDQPLIFINKAFEDMTGYTKAEVIGKNCRFLQGKFRDQDGIAIVAQAIKNKKKCRVLLKNVKKDGTFFWNELSLSPIMDSAGQLTHYIGIQKDMTSEVAQKAKIKYLSEHDDLTNLYNYRGFFNRLKFLLAKAIAEGKMIAIGIADIDFFKKVNDTYGHIAGNNILKVLGAEINSEFNQDSVVARFGGDEFCFAMIVKDDDSEFFYDKIDRVVTATNSSLSSTLQVSMSAGIAIESASEQTKIDNLIQLADTVMYNHKSFVHHKNPE
jgi:diguanylate cyclase (GGDEF)-like protein/PAS domain S-box-containing protein